MNLAHYNNLPRSSNHSILFPIDGGVQRVYLVRLPLLDTLQTGSKYVHDYNCWYLNRQDYELLQRERGNIKNIKKAFARTEQITLTD